LPPRRGAGAPCRWLLIGLLALLAAAPAPAADPVERPSLTLAFVGDILLAGRVQQEIAREGPGAPFAGVAAILRNADLAVGNLECPLSTRGRAVEKTYTFRASPDTAESLHAAGFEIVSLANNHSGDYGKPALLDTLAACQAHGVKTVGAGDSLKAAREPVLVSVGRPPQRVALLAYSNMQPTEFYASDSRAGTNPARVEEIKRDVAAARAGADIVVVLFHFGQERSPTPTKTQRLLAHAAADAGADLVIGHHPHVLQGLERYHHSLIAYSLGNFLFPSHRPETRETAILSFSRSPDGVSEVRITPCIITPAGPVVAEKKDRASILARLGKLSRELGTSLPADGRMSW